MIVEVRTWYVYGSHPPNSRWCPGNVDDAGILPGKTTALFLGLASSRTRGPSFVVRQRAGAFPSVAGGIEAERPPVLVFETIRPVTVIVPAQSIWRRCRSRPV